MPDDWCLIVEERAYVILLLREITDKWCPIVEDEQLYMQKTIASVTICQRM